MCLESQRGPEGERLLFISRMTKKKGWKDEIRVRDEGCSFRAKNTLRKNIVLKEEAEITSSNSPCGGGASGERLLLLRERGSANRLKRTVSGVETGEGEPRDRFSNRGKKEFGNGTVGRCALRLVGKARP